MTGPEYAASLREIADFIDAHDELEFDAPNYLRLGWCYGSDNEAQQQIAAFARAFGSCEKEYGDAFFKVSRKIGEIKVYAATSREKVCRKVVKGTRVVPRQVIEAKIIEEHEEEIVEWECEPLLAEALA